MSRGAVMALGAMLIGSGVSAGACRRGALAPGAPNPEEKSAVEPPEVPSEASLMAGSSTLAALTQQLTAPPSSYDFSSNEKLVDRILASPHGYFRFINVRFSEAICRRLEEAREGVPLVNLHGDAHLEQYAVTDLGRGLTDFDDSTKGPALLDLLRFGVSIRLALEAHLPARDPAALFSHFLDGYRSALQDPESGAPEPEWVQTVQAGFSRDRARYFEWIANKMMQPIAKAKVREVKKALSPYVAAMKRKHQELAPDFFQVVQLGRLKMGIGSALDEKYLVRIRGASKDPLDDIILELKEVRSLAGISCIEGGGAVDPFRILLAQSRIAYKPYDYVGYIDLEGKKFWIHSWVDNYRELGLDRLSEVADSIEAIVYDVGVQLGRGHPKIAADFDIQLRQAQLRFLDENEKELKAWVPLIAEATVQAWKRFRAQLGPRVEE